MQFSELSAIVQGEVVVLARDRPINFLLTDSRKLVVHEGALFFALTGERHDGHDYIRAAYESGVRQFVTEKNYPGKNFPEANILRVSSSIVALQKIVTRHRQQFFLPVMGITGSNGKTIVKEWLYQLLGPEYHIIKSPGSYNSQVGVPLSVWQLQSHHQLGIFEAGISKPGEMEKLEKVIRPTWGIFTNIGTAHDENFIDQKSKIEEKLKLFRSVETLIYCRDNEDMHKLVKKQGLRTLSWGSSPDSDILVTQGKGPYKIAWKEKVFEIEFPFTHEAFVENALHCLVMMLAFDYEESIIQQRIKMLQAIPMRLELKEGINQCQIIDDTYNNDLGGLQISLDFLLNQRQKEKKIIILSDILQSGLAEEILAKRLGDMVNNLHAHKFIGIGPVLSENRTAFTIPSAFFPTAELFLQSFNPEAFRDAIILVKGARTFQFERIIRLLQKKVHGTIMEVSLGAIAHNLNYFRSKLKPETKLMMMVKAFAYGSGSVEMANLLQFHQVDYLGVAYVDEGVQLRQGNITTPIMVMNPSAESFHSLLEHDLEPEIFSFKILDELITFLKGRKLSVHIKLDTGMNRLGFDEDDLTSLIKRLNEHPNINVVSIFSHLAGSDDENHDDFSRLQVNRFIQASQRIKEGLHSNPLLHILNTSGILRLPEYQLDMVRLGIGLYGAEATYDGRALKPAVTLKTVISQIKNVGEGESIGYGRKGVAKAPMKLATIAIGYADGFSRALSNGVGEVLVHGKRAPVVGNVCMDMTMVDITGIDAREGDSVIVFGEQLPISEVAARINTISYEILTNTSERVKRVLVAESI